jgi:hypothetical protein
MRHDGAEVRKQRIEEIARAVMSALNAKGELQLSKTVSALQLSGLTEEKIMEYLEILENNDRFTLDRDHDKIKKAS